jgi:membrane-bound lytic murein transglycosylase B
LHHAESAQQREAVGYAFAGVAATLRVSDTRIADGRAILAKYRTQFDAMEKAYGVDRHVIAAIWGIESKYST